MTIDIDPPISSTVQITAYEIEAQTDSPVTKTVTAKIKLTGAAGVTLMLWSGDAYDEIGNWTQAQANARVLTLLQEMFSDE